MADDRAKAEAAEQTARDQAAAEAAEIEALAKPGAQLPPNTDIRQSGDTTYVTTRTDAGEVASVRSASTDADNVSVSNTQYNEDGTATRQSVEVSKESAVTQEATWNEARSANPLPPPTQTENGPVYLNPEAASPLDRVDTNTTVTPRGGEPQQIKQASFSQEGVRVTSTDTFNEQGEPNPRSWTLDRQVSPTERRSQDFVEGNQDFQRVTTTHADGNRVNVSTETQWKNEDGVDQRATEDSNTTYADDGTAARSQGRTVDEKGTKTSTDYQRITAENSETTESTIVSQDPADGPELTTTEDITTRPGANGHAEFVRGSVTTVGPGGRGTDRIGLRHKLVLDTNQSTDYYSVCSADLSAPPKRYPPCPSSFGVSSL